VQNTHLCLLLQGCNYLLTLLRKSLPAGVNIVFLIDELEKSSVIGPSFPENIRNRICVLQDTEGVVAILST
jgi:hypothetical protein